MPKNNETKLGNYFKLPNPGLRSYFDIVRRGQPEIYRAPFAKGKDVQEVLEEWEPYLSQIADKWPTLMDFENDLRGKVGPMSVMKPLSERMKDIDHYYTDVLLSSKPLDPRAIKAVESEFNRVKGLRVRSEMRTVELMKKSTNSGSPYFTKRRNVVDSTVPCVTFVNGNDVDMYLNAHVANHAADSGVPYEYCIATKSDASDDWKACAVLGWRGQEGGPKADDVKQRVVWMFPFGVNINELQVYQPLIEACQRFNLVPAWVSMESVDKRITDMFDTKGKEDLVVCTDFSKFDQHFNTDMQNAAKDILWRLSTQDGRWDHWFKNVFPIKYVIPLMYDLGEFRTGPHGMGSGSGGTNADETLAHRALQYEAALANHSKLNPNSQCLGDDGVLTYPGITVEDVVRSYTAHGQEMNESKQYASKHDCTYLRRWHHEDYRVDGICVGVYSTYRALGRLMEQERFYDPDVWSEKMVALRQLSIIENVKWHPLRDQFAEFCMARDKYRLGIDIPGFLDNISELAKEAIDHMPDFLGYTKTLQGEDGSGIANWEVVKYLKSKA
jgi:hypothetical protein